MQMAFILLSHPDPKFRMHPRQTWNNDSKIQNLSNVIISDFISQYKTAEIK